MSDENLNSSPADQAAGAEELLTLEEAVQFLGTSKPTVYRSLANGELRGLKVGRQWRFRRSDLTAYMERSPIAVAVAPNTILDAELKFFASPDEPSAGSESGQSEPAASSYEERVGLLADAIVARAVAARASDIHLEPVRSGDESYLWLRYRIDGLLHEIRRIPQALTEAITLQFKQMAEMNLAERRVAQDGRFKVQSEDTDLEIRMSDVPMLHGESLVMRILDRGKSLVGLNRLGLEAQALERLRHAINQPNGLVIVTGPTGSGKTTTVYSCLTELADEGRKTLTVEEPVELTLPFVTQIQTNRRYGMTFEGCMRSAMRQDPDILFCGELRDRESVQLVIEGALTGHLVFTILHADDTAGAIRRLLEMGVEPYLVAGSLICVVAQRLIRKICDHCKESAGTMPSQVAPRLRRLAAAGGYSLASETVYFRGRGCDQCRGTGYRGRTGLFEVLKVTPEIGSAIALRAPAVELEDAIVASGTKTLLAEGMRLAAEGVTTWDEVMRVVGVTA